MFYFVAKNCCLYIQLVMAKKFFSAVDKINKFVPFDSYTCVIMQLDQKRFLVTNYDRCRVLSIAPRHSYIGLSVLFILTKTGGCTTNNFQYGRLFLTFDSFFSYGRVGTQVRKPSNASLIDCILRRSLWFAAFRWITRLTLLAESSSNSEIIILQ